MLLRSISGISSRRAVGRIPRQVITQIPSFVSPKNEFSSKPQQRTSPQLGPTGEPPESGSSVSKLLIGGVAIGAAVLAGYQTGYLDKILGGSKEQKASIDTAKISIEKRDKNDAQNLIEPQSGLPHKEEAEESNPNVEYTEQKVEANPNLSQLEEAAGEGRGDDKPQFQDKTMIIAQEEGDLTKDKDLIEFRQSSEESSDQKTKSFDLKSSEEDINTRQNEEGQATPPLIKAIEADGESKIEAVAPNHATIEEKPEDVLVKAVEPPNSLLEEYNLKDEADITSLSGEGSDEDKFHKEAEALITAINDLNDAYISKDGKLVLDFIQAIHTAEERQAELDARVFSEEKRALKEKYEKKLKEAGVRELMLAEEAALLEKELNRERAKAVAALKSLQEKLEDKLQKELEQKEIENEDKLKKVEELAKAELAAAIASEKAVQIEKLAEANLYINALGVAFYTRSEETRQSHSAQKLAMGALAIEDALSRGPPIEEEIDALRSNIQGIDKDSNLDLVLSSIPKEILSHGTDTQLELNHRFDSLKGTLRHFSLIPPGGGGILAHSLARVASWLKVKEVDQSGNGIESVINRVEGYLTEGNLAEAAEYLEEAVKGTQTEDIVSDWVKRARNRAITEQALILLQSYATSISLA